MLLVLAENASRSACHDYYQARGCTVDLAASALEAAPLLRFRAYDLVVADFPRAEPARTEIVRLLGQSRRKSPNRVLLTAGDTYLPDADDSLIVLTKPYPLEAILALGTKRAAAPSR